MEAKLWEKIDYLVGNLYLKGSIPKHIQSWGIESQPPVSVLDTEPTTGYPK
jgi:hypothetical protein